MHDDGLPGSRHAGTGSRAARVDSPSPAIPAAGETADRAGSCNTPPRDKFVPPAVGVLAAGVDTLKLVSYVGDDRSVRAIEGLGTRSAAGGARQVMAAIPDARVFFYPATSLLGIEGHPGGEGALASGDDLAGWAEDVRELLYEQGLRLDDRLMVARCDAAVNVSTVPADGAAILAGAAAVVPPRLKVDTWRSRAGLETVYYARPGGSKVARLYDWGVAHDPRGIPRHTNLRAEDQRRADRPSRREDVRHLSTESVRHAFRERFGALAKATEGVTVASVPVLIDKLGVLVEQGGMTWAQAERAIGYVMLTRSGAAPVSRKTTWRRQTELRELGLVVAEGELAPVEVNLGEVYERIAEEGAWA